MSAFSPDRRWLRRTGCRVLAAALLPLAAGLSARGDSPPTADELVRQLGASAFEQREQAEELLLQQGVTALEALRNATGSTDLERSYRARRLIGRIEHQQQWRLLEHFLSDYDPELAQQLPGWPLYAELVGDDLPARALFVEMFEAEPEIMSALRDPALGSIVEKRVLEMRPDNRTQSQPHSIPLPAAATGVLMLASLQPDSNVSGNLRSLVNTLVNESAFQRAIAAQDDPPIRRLLSAWVGSARDVSASIRMNIGNRFALRATVSPAMELIAARVHGSQFQYAVFAIARLGTAEQIPVLEDQLQNATVLSERQRGDDERFTCQARDVALAGLIHLIGKQPREFGFTELRPNSNSLYGLNTAGFASDELRNAAFGKWRLWHRMQRRAGLDVGETAILGSRL